MAPVASAGWTPRGPPAAGRRFRLPYADSLGIMRASGPRDPPPWRGNLSLPGLETSVELARDEPTSGPSRLVLRTGIVWLLVKEWRELELVRAVIV